ncbi:MAG: RNA-binding domain-containing protein [Nitrososphaeria archaeon]
MEIKKFLLVGESEKVKFKNSLSEEDEILETICAFLNSSGGTILVGVDDNGNIVGVDIGKKTVEDLINKIKFSIEPMVIPQIEIFKSDDKNIVAIKVLEGMDKPYFLKGVVYKRFGKTNQKVSREMLERMIVEKHKELVSFEERSLDVDFKDFDEGKIKDFVSVVKDVRNIDLIYSTVEEFLERLGLIRNGKPTYGAVLCFFKYPQIHVPYAIVKCGRFKDSIVIDDKEYGGDLISQVKESLGFLKNHINSFYTVDESGKRIENYEIPVWVLREVLVNAIVHRDYSIPSPTYVKVFDDRIEVINPGNLLPPLTTEDLKREHPSILRNQKIANIFFLYGYVERWGYGTNRIIELCAKNGLKEPEFIEDKGFFKVIIYRKMLNELEKTILELIKNNINTSKSIAKKLKINDRTVRKYLSSLVSKNLVYRKKVGRKVIYYYV